MNRIRCAIYTRKSSEEGLEQSFNSLHAQREACAAYIKSQASECWSLNPDEYDDGGISGGTLNRPALQRLLADIAANKVDIVVVYKVDRLTRSLMDFSSLVQAFDQAGTSFVSVTQSFNTTTSMGRLTLNMLLSFAQFEREVIAERVRDKIAASKAKGMWMGGVPPIGYKPAGRTLEIVEEHAATVRQIFARFLEVDSVRELERSLVAARIFTPVRHTLDRRQFGGIPFSRGQLFPMLKNHIYLGEIEHKGAIYPGQHSAIIDRELWDRVQQRLADRTRGQRKPTAAHPSLLAGLVFDADGQPLVATHACKGSRRYRYYVSRALQHKHEEQVGDGMRIPANELEGAVVERLVTAFEEPLTLIATAGLPLVKVDLASIQSCATEVAARVRLRNAASIRGLVKAVYVGADALRLELCPATLSRNLSTSASPDHPPIELTINAKLSRAGKAMRLIQLDGRRASGAVIDDALINLLAKARRWWGRLQRGDIHAAELARQEGVTRSYMSNALRMAFLSPQLVALIAKGDQPAELTAKRLMLSYLPSCWREQHARFG